MKTLESLKTQLKIATDTMESYIPFLRRAGGCGHDDTSWCDLNCGDYGKRMRRALTKIAEFDAEPECSDESKEDQSENAQLLIGELQAVVDAKDREISRLKASNEKLREVAVLSLDLIRLSEEGKPQPTTFYKRLVNEAILDSLRSQTLKAESEV